MEFTVYRTRTAGKLLPRHVMWSTLARGRLYVREGHDAELHRTVRQATIETGEGLAVKVLAGPLLDVVLVSAKPDWWTMTGWERVASSAHVEPLAFQQSWVLVPVGEG